MELNDKWIIKCRGKKNPVSSDRPYGWLVEKEHPQPFAVHDTGVIFLTNCECLYHCLMCDLWKNTLDHPVSHGTIPQQIEWALKQMPPVSYLKLYNSGSFFDPRAVPPGDYPVIAKLLKGFDTVIVESHPAFIGERCLEFKNLLKPDLQVAIGLETSNDELLQKLNKKMTSKDFAKAVEFLLLNDILSRAFILLKPPYLNEEEAISDAKRSIDFAFNMGVECCCVIPVRGGNGAMEALREKGQFSPPKIKSLENVLEYGIHRKMGRIFADLWNLEQFSECDVCFEKRKDRLNKMNLYQRIMDRITCNCGN
jgi:archaeosine synthase beta-subunit